MVATFAPSICHTNTVQDLTALPFTCTTQAPHWDVSQPTCVPVSRRFARRNCTRSVRGSTSPVTALPFTVSATAVMALLLEIRPKASFSHRPGGPAADRGKIGAFWTFFLVSPACAGNPPPKPLQTQKGLFNDSQTQAFVYRRCPT